MATAFPEKAKSPQPYNGDFWRKDFKIFTFKNFYYGGKNKSSSFTCALIRRYFLTEL